MEITNRLLFLAALVFAILTGVGMGNARAATNDVSALLQQGLFEEEANQNLDAAIQAYQAVVAQTDKNRQFAATAIFRLGECYRKEGKTNEAAAQYQRILSEYADQTQLAKLSQQNLAGMGMMASAPVPTNDAALQTQKQLLDQEIKLLEDQVKSQQQRVNQGVLSTDELAVTQQKLLELKRQLAALEAGQPISTATAPAANDEEATELQRIQGMMQNTPDLITGSSDELANAAQVGYLRVAAFLLDHGANINGSPGHYPPLMGAARRDQKTMVELLLSRGADIDARDSGGETALSVAAEQGYKSVVEVLLAHHADLNSKRNEGYTALHLAVQKGYTDIAGLLVTNGADVNATADYGYTPLFGAASAGNAAVMELLIAHKADVDAKDNNGLTPLFFAVQANQIDAASLLLKNQADVNALATGGSQPAKGWSPLDVAVAGDEVGMVKLLLEHGAMTGARVPVYANQFTHDRGYGFMQLGDMPGTPFCGDENVPPLIMAVMNGRKEIVQLLIAHHADVNAQASAGDSALTMAAKMDYPNGSGQLPRDRLGITELLLDNGADVNLQNDNRESALSLAVKNNLPEMVKLILAHKPQMDILDNNGWTPLQLAVSARHPEIAGLLLDGGADSNLKYPNVGSNPTWGGKTPLTAAVVMGDKDLVEVLLAHHADPNAPDGSHETPLSWAKERQRDAQNLQQSQTEADIVELLLKAGANENLYRLSVIHASRPGNLRTVFTKQPDLPNHFTLLDLVTQFYAPSYHGQSQLPGLPFPDFARVSISRMKKDGSTNVIRVDLESAFESGDCSKNVPLEWGDIVEIPEADHNVTEDWSGLSDEVRAALRKCVSAQVAIMVKGRTNLVTLKPLIYRKQAGVVGVYGTTGEGSDGNFRRGFGGFTTMNENPAQEASFWLYDVVYGANVILTSSDLTRVKVTRKDAVTRKTVELTFDLEKSDPANALWLRDGDVIEIPEKP